jgi:hypothetical protein
MKALQIIALAVSICGILNAQNEWKITEHDGQEILLHEWKNSDEHTPSISGLSEILDTRDKKLPLKHSTFWSYFNNDPIIQAELLSELKNRYPDVLKAAFNSSGNLHNPKVIPLRDKLSECIMATPTLRKINELFAQHGYRVKNISHEKLWINKGNEKTPFHAIMWLILEPTPKN